MKLGSSQSAHKQKVLLNVNTTFKIHCVASNFVFKIGKEKTC